MKNNNSAIIRRLTGRSLQANRNRNIFIIAAIALTTLLIASVFSIGMSLVESVRMNEIRFAGTVAHAAVGRPTALQMERLQSLDYVQVVGTNNSVGVVKNTPAMGKIALTLHYFDQTEWKELRAPAYANIEGSYPEREDEVMVSLAVLKRLGIETPSIGMEIPLTYFTDSEKKDVLIDGRFRLSGWFTSYVFVKSANATDVIFVSQELSQKYGKTVAKDGSASVMFDNPSRVSEYCDALVSDLGLSDNQPVAAGMRQTDMGGSTTTLIALCAIVVFLIFTGYLLIYNVLYISVARDVRFYGLLKTLGTTPKQIKRIVLGQVLRLCVIGIPIGILLSLMVSFMFVPLFISRLGAVSTEAVVSFSPFIYLGAMILPLLTAIWGTRKPAKKAAGISPIEAQRYTGVEVTAKSSRSAARGKPYQMAFRNILRDKKRARVVLLSLFLGVTTFLTVTTLVFSMNITVYIESAFESDFVLENTSWAAQKFDEAFIDKLESLPGFEALNVTTREIMSLVYSPNAFGEYIANHPSGEQTAGLTEKEIYENFRGFIYGFNSETLAKSNNAPHQSIDVDAFERGEFAIIATDNPSLFSNVHELTISPSYQNGNDTASNTQIKIPLGGFVPLDFKSISSSLAPTVIVSNAFMRECFGEPIVWRINLDVSDDYEQDAMVALKQIIGEDYELSLTSKMESIEELNSAKTGLLVFGGGISFVIALIGILNFVNVMSVSVMVRKRELATLESIGMSHKQIKRMLVCEGLGYAVITLLLVLTAGSAITFGIFKLFQQQATYASFTYPFIPVMLAGFAILTICIATPESVYRTIRKATIVERLRESE